MTRIIHRYIRRLINWVNTPSDEEQLNRRLMVTHYDIRTFPTSESAMKTMMELPKTRIEGLKRNIFEYKSRYPNGLNGVNRADEYLKFIEKAERARDSWYIPAGQ